MSEKLKIVYRPLQELSPYAHNARTHSTEQVAQLVESIKQFGWTNPVLIDEKGEIIAGHGRVMAAEMLKMDSVPVIVLSGLTDEQKKAYRLADNRLPMNAGWDEDLLRMELSDLINADFDVSLTGFIPTEIDELLTDVLPGTGNEEEPYTTKIDTPVYEPSGGKPDISELYDDTKTQELISRMPHRQPVRRRHRHHLRLLQKMRRPDRRQQRRVAPRRHPRRRQRQLAVRRQQLRAKVRRNLQQRALRQRQNGQRILHPPWRLRMRARRKRG
ncbi:TPA: ParB N-terminal domain-containing protein [Escherichia coli]|nr:ParB N-terminal domain-containing protein [Escherichia coli]